MNPLATFTEAFRLQIIEAAPFIGNQIAWGADPEAPNGLIASFPLYGGTLTLRADLASEWCEAPTGSPQIATNWSHASNGSFACGAYTANALSALWNLSSAVEFAARAGDIPSDDE